MSILLRNKILVIILFLGGVIYSQETVPFSNRISFPNIKGNLTVTGNDIVGVIEDANGTSFTNPNRSYNGTDNNGNNVTAYIDVDNDPTTFSSSEAALTVPRQDCSQLVYAGLYWSANYYMARVNTPVNFAENEIASNSNTGTAFIVNNGPLAQQYVVRNSEFDNDTSDIERSPVSSYLVVAQPVNGCGITNVTELSGNIAVVQDGGSCSLREKVVNAQNAGAVGVVIVNDNGLLPRMIGNGPAINIPSVSIGNDDINNANFTNGNLISLLQLETSVVLATLSSSGADDWISNLPLTDPRKQGPADFRNIKFKVPGGSYADVTASSVVFDGYRNTPTNPLGNAANDEVPYVCYADVTSLLDSDNPFGTYTVANMNATQGFTSSGDAACGGWVLVAVYEDSRDQNRFISVSDGFAQIFSGNDPIEFSFSGFTTPPGNQPVDVRYAVASLEGDKNLNGDQLRILSTNNNLIALGESLGTVNPSDNFFNSSISSDGAFITQRTPNSENTQGFDIDIFDLPNDNNVLVGNAQTSATFNMMTDRDRFSVFFNSFAVTIMEPELRIVKRVYDTDGVTNITGGNVELGDEIFYDLEIENIGSEDFVDGSVTITSKLPDNTNLLEVVDASLPPGVTYIEESPGVLQFSIPSSIVESSNQDTPIFIRYKAAIVSGCSELREECSSEIINEVSASYTGLFSGVSAQTSSISGVGVCGEAIADIPNILINVPPCEKDIKVCSEEIILEAKTGFDQYTWSGPGITTPIVTQVNFLQIQNPLSGVYSVIKEDIDGTQPQCLTATEIFNVEVLFETIQNPVLAYVNGIDVTAEECNFTSIPQISLCGDQNFLIETNFDTSSLTSISWQRLIPSGACVSDPNDPCSLLNNNCTDLNWEELPEGNTPNYTVSDAGDYRIVAEFDSGCLIPFYFGVIKNDFELDLTMNPIQCDIEGSVNVISVPENFAFSLTSGGPYTNTTGVFPIATAGDVTVYAIDTIFPQCEYTAVINVPSIDPVVSVTGVDPLCGEQFGKIEVSIVDGTPPYTFTLEGITQIGPTQDNTVVFDNLNGGDYQVQVLDANQCETFESVTINQESSIILEVSNIITPVTCGGSTIVTDLGSIDLEITGGIGDYVYTLVEASNLFVRPLIPAVTISANPIQTTSTEVRFEGLNFGEYYILVSNTGDTTECSQVTFGPYDIASPPDDILTTITVSASCAQGVSLEIMVQGGSGIAPPTNPPPGFDIRLVGESSPGLGNFIPLNDLAGGSTAVDANTPIRDHLYEGLAFHRSYTIEIRDNITNCIYREEISPIIPPFGPDIVNFSITDDICNQVPGFGSGKVDFEISGYDPSVSQLSWEIFDQVTNVSLGIDFTGNSTNVSGSNIPVVISGLPKGQFYALVREDDGTMCPARKDFEILSSDIAIPITADVAITQDYSCSASGSINEPQFGEITVSNPTGGNGQYEYSLDAINWSTNNQFTGLIDGVYSIFIRDTNTINCPVSLGEITIDPLNQVIDLDFSASEFLCDNPLITITLTPTGNGGSDNFEYRISDPVLTPWQSSEVFVDLEQGNTYTFEARTEDSCVYSEDYTINSIDPLQGTLTINSDVPCFGGTGGIVRLAVSGGIPPYSFTSSINPALFYTDSSDGIEGEHTFVDIPAGSHEFLVQDSLGCSFIIPAMIFQPSAIVISNESNGIGEIIVDASGGTPPYSYELLAADGVEVIFPIQGSNSFLVDSSGDYIVRVLDANNCESSEPITVEINDDNPLIDNADEILFCALTGQSYPVINIVNENGEVVDVPFTNVLSIVWQQLDEINCNVSFDENCPTTDDSCSSDWFDIEIGQNCTITESGQYRVVITFITRSKRQSIKTYYFRADTNTLSVDEEEISKINFYPNPANALVNINATVKTVRVFDMSGKQILETNQNTFNISHLESGVYFTEIETVSGGRKIVKLLKE
ncbi:hypothetical protein GCM10009430_07020 [Aquimarina litoralis]|uniref:Uncharacterized protein n=1 Tax=Aquimarina litoralis TaxID=584605 RepID=A0ABP3TR27_9FLAO